MTPPLKVILLGVSALAVVWFGYAKVVRAMYLEPRAAALAQIESASKKLAEYRQCRDDHPRVNHELRQYIDRTLGENLEVVDHKLRSRLSRLAEQCGLQPKSIVVGTSGGAKAAESPARSAFTGALRSELDFLELEGWVSGVGTFAQVLALVDAIEAEPWIKRVDEVKLDPSDNGERFGVAVRLTTLFFPGRSPNSAATLTVNRPGPERFSALASVNPFRVPPANVRPASADAAHAGFPYDQWALTGVAQSLAGSEIWLLNAATRESRRLTLGETFQELTLIAARGEIAEFSQGQQRVIVRVGQNLGDRRPVAQ